MKRFTRRRERTRPALARGACRICGARQSALADGSATTTADAAVLRRALEESDRFRRDTGLGAIYHRGRASFRELTALDSLHVIVAEDRVSGHVDRISPLKLRRNGTAGYSPARIVAHNLAGIRDHLAGLLRGHERERCHLTCKMLLHDGGWSGAVPPAGLDRATADVLVDSNPVAAAPARIPFGAVDEAVHLLHSEVSPWSVQVEVRVAGTLDDTRLGAAVTQALTIHPMARVRKMASRRTAHHDHWEIPGGVDVDPLGVVDCPDDEALAAARAQLQNITVPLTESPPLRLRLAHHRDGDVLMLNANHAAMDAVGALRLLLSVGRAYAGELDPAPEPGLLESRQLIGRLAATDFRTKVRRGLALAEKVRDLLSPTARLAPQSGSGEAGYGFHQLSLSAPQTRGLVEADHAGTMNDLLLTALHLTIESWNTERNKPCRRIGVLVPANLRPREWHRDVVGNFSLPARVSTSARSRRSPALALERLTTQTVRKKKAGMGTALVDVLARSDLLPLWAKQAMVMAMPLTANRLVDTAMLSNLGQLVETPSFGPDAGDTVEVWFSPPGRMPLGLTIGAVTVADRLHLTFRYRHSLFDADAATRFADRFLIELEGIGNATSTDTRAAWSLGHQQLERPGALPRQARGSGPVRTFA